MPTAVGTLVYGLHTDSWGSAMFSVDRQFQITVLIVAANVALVGKSLFLQSRPPTGAPDPDPTKTD
jgi:hypothetical protein